MIEKSKIIVWHESYFAGGADWSLIDLLTHWPDKNDRFVLYVNRTHEGLPLLREKMPETVTIQTYTSPLEILERIRGNHPVPRSSIAGPVVKAIALAGGIVSCLRAFRGVKSDLLLMNNGGYPGGISHFIAGSLARLRGVAGRFMIVRNYPLRHYSESRLMRVAGIICQKTMTAIIAVSEDLRQNLVEQTGLPAMRVHTIHNGIAIENKTGGRGGVHDMIGREGPAVGIIGTLEERKGHRQLFAAWQKVLAYVPEAKLYVVSSSQSGDRPALERLARTLGIDGSVRWLAFTPNIGDVYGRLDLVVVPSQGYESFGRVVVEAMAFKKPVVAARVGGIPEILTDGWEGFLVDPTDMETMAERIIELLGSSRTREEMGRRGYETYRARFTASIMAGNYYRFLQGGIAVPGSGL